MSKVKNPLPKRAWRPAEFLEEVPVGRSQLFEWLKDGTVDSVKVGGVRLITTSPVAFLERHRAKATAA